AWDRRAAKQPDVMIANSTYTQEMIRKYYHRDSVVIHPPVDTERYKIRGTPPARHGFVTAGRQVPYKRIDLAVMACSELKVPLVVIGNGPEHRRLERLAGRNVTFLTAVSDEDMAKHFQSALAFIFPTNTEDFGVTAVEAMAAGTPVIAYSKGGPRDYIVPNKTGLYFDKLSVKSLVKTLEGFSPSRFDSKVIAAASDQFSALRFDKEFKLLLDTLLKERSIK
ncbi:MAG: glycosyltransferase, partial [Candidatus Saccharimonadales bacterium]